MMETTAKLGGQQPPSSSTDVPRGLCCGLTPPGLELRTDNQPLGAGDPSPRAELPPAGSLPPGPWGIVLAWLGAGTRQLGAACPGRCPAPPARFLGTAALSSVQVSPGEASLPHRTAGECLTSPGGQRLKQGGQAGTEPRAPGSSSGPCWRLSRCFRMLNASWPSRSAPSSLCSGHWPHKAPVGGCPGGQLLPPSPHVVHLCSWFLSALLPRPHLTSGLARCRPSRLSWVGQGRSLESGCSGMTVIHTAPAPPGAAWFPHTPCSQHLGAGWDPPASRASRHGSWERGLRCGAGLCPCWLSPTSQDLGGRGHGLCQGLRA